MTEGATSGRSRRQEVGRRRDSKGSPLSRHVVSQRLSFGLESTATNARASVCVPGGKDTRGCVGAWGEASGVAV